jgi:Amino acid permease
MEAVITAGPAAEQPAAAAGRLAPGPAEGFWYQVKRRVLGPPLVTGQLRNERLSRPLALGVLSCDGLSSAAYGTEEILYALLPFFGLAAFTLVLPITLIILFGVLLVVLSYREVVAVYTKAGGSYVVARENFGPRVAQVAAVALLIDYVVTVAVQTAAGSAAIVSAFPALSRIPVIGPKILLVISVIAICVMCLGNSELDRTRAPEPPSMFASNGFTVAAGGSPWSLPTELRALACTTPADGTRGWAW